MIQIGTYIKVIDNSGARLVLCIRFLNGFKQRRANIGDVIVVVVKTLRLKRRAYIKVTKGAVLYALITQSKRGLKMFNGDQVNFLQCSVIILNKTKNWLVLEFLVFYQRNSDIVDLCEYWHFLRVVVKFLNFKYDDSILIFRKFEHVKFPFFNSKFYCDCHFCRCKSYAFYIIYDFIIF